MGKAALRQVPADDDEGRVNKRLRKPSPATTNRTHAPNFTRASKRGIPKAWPPAVCVGNSSCGGAFQRSWMWRCQFPPENCYIKGIVDHLLLLCFNHSALSSFCCYSR